MLVESDSELNKNKQSHPRMINNKNNTNNGDRNVINVCSNALNAVRSKTQLSIKSSILWNFVVIVFGEIAYDRT